MLYMGVQTNGSTVSAALQGANRAVRAVTGALARTGVRGSDIQTSGLSIQPDYTGNTPVPAGYGVSESINVTLRTLAAAGTQISDAVRAGGNATQVDGVSLNLNDTGSLLAAARAKAAADARAKAAQYARALGLSLGPVVSVSEQHPAPPLPVFAAPSAGRQRRMGSAPGPAGSRSAQCEHGGDSDGHLLAAGRDRHRRGGGVRGAGGGEHRHHRRGVLLGHADHRSE